MNMCVMSGFLGKDPEMRYSQNGNGVATLSLAVRREFKKDKDPETDWFKCTAFGKKAEFCEKYLTKGSRVIIRGKVQNDDYEKDGVKRYGTQIIIEDIEFAESKKSSDKAESNSTDTAKDDEFMNIPDGIDDELPFN